MRLTRLTTRRLMVLVAVAALSLAAYAWMVKRSEHFLKLAIRHWELCEANSVRTVRPDGTVDMLGDPASPREQRLAKYHRLLSWKYSAASGRPWLPVPPDPPPPD